jgi:hypothetical protein
MKSKSYVSKRAAWFRRIAFVAILVPGLEWMLFNDFNICSATPPNVCSLGRRVTLFGGHAVIVFAMGAMAPQIFMPRRHRCELSLHSPKVDADD